MNGRVRVAVATIYVLAIAAWAGGLVVLGAIVAPTVFRIVPAPSSADAMTVVFRRFDAVAMTAAAIALVAEATLFLKDGGPARLDVARGAAAVVASILAIVVGTWLSPGISELHRSGAIRGLNEGGVELERLHRLAEAAGKGQLALLLVVLVLLLAKLARSPAVD